jgi:hypothetical protein
MSNPKDKAQELVLKYLRIENTNDWWSKVPAKQCALIAVDEILIEIRKIYDIYTEENIIKIYQYLQEVKIEILKL